MEEHGLATPKAQPDRRVRSPLNEEESRRSVEPVGDVANVGCQFDNRVDAAGCRRLESNDANREKGDGAAGRAGTALADDRFGVLSRKGAEGPAVNGWARWSGTDVSMRLR